METRDTHIHALLCDWLTPLYDPLLKGAMREVKFKRVKRITLASLLFFALLLTACSGGSSSSKTQEISLEAADLQFTPTAFEVTAGQPVRLTFKNSGALDHDFTIMEIPLEGKAASSGGMDHDMSGLGAEPQLHIDVKAGETGTLEFTPTKPGSYEWFCSVAGHKDAGMTGTLIVK